MLTSDLLKSFARSSLLFFVLVILNGCIFESDLDVLNRANEARANELNLKVSYLCYDIDGSLYMPGSVVEFNGEVFKCVIVNSAKWVLKKELLNEN